MRISVPISSRWVAKLWRKVWTLTVEEEVRFFAAVPSLKHRTALMTAYAARLRVSEVVRLRVADNDSDRASNSNSLANTVSDPGRPAATSPAA